MNKYSPLNSIVWILLVSIPFVLQQHNIINTSSLLISKDNGWWSIITGSFLHGGVYHFSGNITGLIVGVALLLNMYPKDYWKTIIFGILVPSSIMYFLGGKSLGISGLVFTIVWFVIFRGLLSKDIVRFVVSIILIIFYGYTVKTVFFIPFSGIAYQSHLTGLLLGLMIAFYSKIFKN